MNRKWLRRSFLGGWICIGCWCAGCAPQARFFNVDVRRPAEHFVPVESGRAAVIAVSSRRKIDTLCLGNAASGLAARLEEDRGWPRNRVPAYTLPADEFIGFTNPDMPEAGERDREYIRRIADTCGADVLFFIGGIRFEPVIRKGNRWMSESYEMESVQIPYAINLDIYDMVRDSLLYGRTVRDTAYLQLITGDPENRGQHLNRAVYRYLPDLSSKIGERLASFVTPQWETQERMLITYEGGKSWENAYLMAQEFRWKEAIETWMPLTRTENPKKAACAAYNIAVACEMLEQFDLARKWVAVSLERYRFREAVLLQEELEKL